MNAESKKPLTKLKPLKSGSCEACWGLLESIMCRLKFFCRVDLEPELFGNIKNLGTGYLGHILLGKRYYFERSILQSKIEAGRLEKVRSKLSWLRNIPQKAVVSIKIDMTEKRMNAYIEICTLRRL